MSTCGLMRVDGVDEAERRVLVRVGQVVRHQVRSALHDQTVDVHEPQPAARLVEAQPLVHQRRRHQVGDAGRGGSGAEEHDAQIRELATW